MFFAEADSNSFMNVVFYVLIFGFIIVANIIKSFKENQRKKESAPKDSRHEPVPSIEAEKAMKELMEALGMKPEEVTASPAPVIPRRQEIYIEEEEGDVSQEEHPPIQVPVNTFCKAPSIREVSDEELKLALQMEKAEQRRSVSSEKFSFNKSRLREAVILKEILDPPVALR
jgi:hypothetical protein